MNPAGDAADQVVKMSFNGLEFGLRITGAAAKQLAILIYAILKEQKKTRGKARMNTMLRSGKELRVFAVKPEDLKTFCQEAKRYGVLYCVLKSKNSKDSVVDVMVRAEDASKINRIFEKFEMATVDMGTIEQDLERGLEKAGEGEIQTQQQEERGQSTNPTKGREAKSSPSEPTYEARRAAGGTSKPNAKPSVKQELRNIREQQGKNAARGPQQSKTPTNRTPKPKVPKGKGR